MYYKIFSNYITKDTIHESELQIKGADYHCDIFGPNSISSYYGKKLEPNNIILPDIKLNSKMIPTDLIDIYSVSISGLGPHTLIASTKLKSLIMDHADASWTCIPIKIIHREKLLLHYWLIHGYQDRSDIIDYRQTKFSICNSIGNKLSDIYIESHEAYLEASAELATKRQFIRKEQITFNESLSNAHLLYLNFVSDFSPSIYVSESLKSVIDTDGCTGIGFDPH
jgi:hypothetical protein